MPTLRLLLPIPFSLVLITALPAQTSTLALADSLLQEAVKLSSGGQYQQLLQTARAAEAAYLEVLGRKDPRLAKPYALIGQCLLKIAPDSAGIYLDRIAALDSTDDPAILAQVHYFKGSYSQFRGENTAALAHYRRALELFPANPGEQAKICSNMGVAFAGLSRYEEALAMYARAIDLGTRTFGPDHPFLAHPYNNRGLIYLEKGLFQQALHSFHKALDLNLAHLGPDHPNVAVAYINIGLIHANQGEFARAEGYLYKALDISLRQNLTHYLPYVYTNLGLCSSGRHEPGQELVYFKKAQAIEEAIFPPHHPNLVSTHISLATTYRDLGDLDSALVEYQIAKDIAGEDYPYLGQIYLGLGLLMALKKDFPAAAAYYDKGLERERGIFGEKHINVAAAYFNLADLEKEMGHYTEALALNRKAYESLDFYGDGKPAHLLSKLDACKVLAQECQLLWLHHRRLGSGFGQVTAACERAWAVFSEFRNGYQAASDRQTLMASAGTVLETAVAAGLAQQRLAPSADPPEALFAYAERARGLLLHDALLERGALAVAGIPDSLLQLELGLRADLAFYEKMQQEMRSAQVPEEDSSSLDLSARLFQLDSDYRALKAFFEKKYPKYYEARYGLATRSVDEVQARLLSPGQCLLEYLVGDSSVFIFLVQKDHFEIQEVKLDFPLAQWVRDMTSDGLFGFYALPEARRTDDLEAATALRYTQAARNLYEKLVAPVKGKLAREVIVVPDGPLGYLPFEALLTADPPRTGAFQAYPYLLLDHQISYCYSATLLDEMRQGQPATLPDKPLLAMAPFFTGNADSLFNDQLALRESLSPLPNSGQEVADAVALFGGAPFFGQEASLDRFRELAGKYPILHLSTHGKADDRAGDFAYLAFSAPDSAGRFEKLYARDLYALDLYADMVVLSACETGIGKLQKGEGIVSLARAFAFAGAGSIFTTLWPVGDASTQELVTTFYQYLKKGWAKDAALRQAKLDFLEKNRGQGGAAHPFFWAGMIGIGDMRPLGR